MPIATIEMIPANRRDIVYAEIRQLVNEVEAVDRSLDRLEEGWAVDDVLETIIIRLNQEIRRARKSRRRVSIDIDDQEVA